MAFLPSGVFGDIFPRMAGREAAVSVSLAFCGNRQKNSENRVLHRRHLATPLKIIDNGLKNKAIDKSQSV